MCAFHGEFCERRSENQGSNASPANERVVDAGNLPFAREGLPSVEMSQELPFLGTGASFARAEGRAARVGRLQDVTHEQPR